MYVLGTEPRVLDVAVSYYTTCPSNNQHMDFGGYLTVTCSFIRFTITNVHSVFVSGSRGGARWFRETGIPNNQGYPRFYNRIIGYSVSTNSFSIILNQMQESDYGKWDCDVWVYPYFESDDRPVQIWATDHATVPSAKCGRKDLKFLSRCLGHCQFLYKQSVSLNPSFYYIKDSLIVSHLVP